MGLYSDIKACIILNEVNCSVFELMKSEVKSSSWNFCKFVDILRDVNLHKSQNCFSAFKILGGLQHRFDCTVKALFLFGT